MKKTKNPIHISGDDAIINQPVLSKEAIIQILRDENPPVDGDLYFNQLFLIVEFKKVSEIIGIIKGELYNNDKLDFRGSLIIPLSQNDDNQQKNWNTIEIGKSVFYGLSFDSRELCITEKIKEFFNRSISEGKIQDFIPFTGVK